MEGGGGGVADFFEVTNDLEDGSGLGPDRERLKGAHGRFRLRQQRLGKNDPLRTPNCEGSSVKRDKR